MCRLVPIDRVAFEQALELDESCVGAMVGLAVLNLNERTRSRVGGGGGDDARSTERQVELLRDAIKLLSRAYALDCANPLVCVLLADHLFYKKVCTMYSTLCIGERWWQGDLKGLSHHFSEPNSEKFFFDNSSPPNFTHNDVSPIKIFHFRYARVHFR